MTPDIVVGCPVRRRAWIMPRWFDHVQDALEAAGCPGRFVFVVDPGDETRPILQERTRAHRVATAQVSEIVPVAELREYQERQWQDEARLRGMVALRNLLLAAVRSMAPEAFISVDSDVLLHPMAIADLLEGLGRFDAVGGGTFMSAHRGPAVFPAGHHHPSCGWIEGHDGLVRRPIEHRGVIPVGVIMAVKAMGPRAYSVDYQYSGQGEDVGWSAACAQAGVRLGWDNRHPSKHVMSREALDEIDERCGF